MIIHSQIMYLKPAVFLIHHLLFLLISENQLILFCELYAIHLSEFHFAFGTFLCERREA